MRQIAIDIETYSSVNLAKAGVYPYAASSDFELLLFGYAVDFGPVKVLDLTQGENIPAKILQALDNPHIIKSAFSAQFAGMVSDPGTATFVKGRRRSARPG